MDRPLFIDHRGFPPDSALLGWQINGAPDYTREMIIPKGCIEIIFNFSADRISYFLQEKNEVILPRCFISGINTSPVILDHSSHHALFGLRLHPHVIQTLLSVPSGEFINQAIDLTLVDPFFSRLWHQLYPLDFGGRIASIDTWIRQAYNASREPYQPHRDLDKAVSGFFDAPIRDLTVARLSEQFCSSQRNLTRKFNELLGMCTEEAILYKKYLHSLDLVHHTRLRLTEIAYESNFYDQSHLTREFKRYTGLTPKDYRKRKGPVCGHIFTQPGSDPA
jgi:AraC-like DNA-binding protein